MEAQCHWTGKQRFRNSGKLIRNANLLILRFYWSLQSVSYEFEVFTYNQSTIVMLDEDENEVDDWDTTYNRNVKKNKWEPGKSNWESVSFTCGAYGGRPEPVFTWYIENNDNDNLEDDDHFR